MNTFWREAWDTVKPGVQKAVTILATVGAAGLSIWIAAEYFDVSIEDILALVGQG